MVRRTYKLSCAVLLVMAMVLTGCKNVEKLVDQGRYDEAIEYASRKLAGKTKKKQRLVASIERAFEKAQRRDMQRIEALEARQNPRFWEEVYDIASRIERRQRQVEPMLPLVDQYGYKADFEFVKVGIIKNEARAGAAKYLYNQGMEYMSQARQGDKLAAREAHAYFVNVMDYEPDYRDARSQADFSRLLGTTFIAFNIENNSEDYLPIGLEQELVNMYGNNISDRWKEIHIYPTNDLQYDLNATLIIESVNVTPERLEEHTHYFNRVIEERRVVKDDKGKVVRDSSGREITFTQQVEVNAQVLQVLQFKESLINGRVVITDAKTDRVVAVEPVSARADFYNEACRVYGDRRAIVGKSFQYGSPVDFPSNEAMILNAADKLKPSVINYMLNNRFLL